jgi:hypothetical protein
MVLRPSKDAGDLGTKLRAVFDRGIIGEKNCAPLA